MALNFPFPSSGGFLADGGAAALPPQLFLDKSFDCDPSGYCAVTCSSLFHDPSPSSSPSRPVSPFYDNIADLLPADPFGMGVSATIAGLIEDLATTAGYLEFGDVWSHQAAIGECSTSTCTSSETLPVSAAKGAPHEGLLFALPYLKIPDLLSMERVCKTLNSAIREDTLLWRCIHIGQPLNFTINDDVFLGLTRRARGNLECLFLRECRFITDSCLGLVLMENLKLKQLSIPSCLKITINGLLDNLKQHKLKGGALRQLSLGRLYDIKPEQYKELRALLGLEDIPLPVPQKKPRFYHLRHSFHCGAQSSSASLDVEPCPRCDSIGVIYDCTLSGNGGRGGSNECNGHGGLIGPCRACAACISRCDECGRCIHDLDYEETFFLEWVCFPCMNIPADTQPFEFPSQLPDSMLKSKDQLL